MQRFFSISLLLIASLSLLILSCNKNKPNKKKESQPKKISINTTMSNKNICEIKIPNIPPEKFKKLRPEERKTAFISLILPAVLKANCIISKQREKLIKIAKKLETGEKLSLQEKNFLEKLKKEYRTNNIDELLIRVNTLPPSLVIAQAAIESGWGTSRFFIEGNNVFGIWTFKKESEGIHAKNGNGTVKLRRYRNILHSIEDYYFNINMGWAYKELRKTRQKERDSLKLAQYLKNYSILREEYVRRLQNVIRKNNLQKFDNCTIDSCSDSM